MPKSWLLPVLAAVTAMWGATSALGAPLRGSWGGAGVSLVIANGAADLRADCAHGRIDGPIEVDAAGRFTARGSYEARTPGPQRADEPGDPAPAATFAGRIKGERLQLTIIAASGAVPIRHVLTRGARPVLVRCL